MDLTTGSAEGIDGELVWPAAYIDEQFTGDRNNVAEVKIICPDRRSSAMTEALFIMMDDMPNSIKRLALENPSHAVLLNIGFGQDLGPGNGGFVPFASIFEVEHLSLIIKRPSDPISIECIYAAIRRQNPSALRSFHLTYTEEAMPDVTFEDIVPFFNGRSLPEILIIDETQIDFRRLYGLDRITKVLETTEIEWIDMYALEFEHLRILYFENENHIYRLNAIIASDQFQKLSKFFIRCEVNLIHLLNISVISADAVTIQMYEKKTESLNGEERTVRVRRDSFKKTGRVYSLQPHSVYFMEWLPDDVEKLRLQFFTADKAVFEVAALAVMNKRNLKILDVTGEVGFLIVLIERIRTTIKSQRLENSDIMPQWHLLYMDIGDISSIQAKKYWIMRRFLIEHIIIRFDNYTPEEKIILRKIQKNIAHRGLEYNFVLEKRRSRLLLAYNPSETDKNSDKNTDSSA